MLRYKGHFHLSDKSGVRLDVYEMVFSPAEAAQIFLYEAAAKRWTVVKKTTDFITKELDTANVEPRRKSGAMQMMGLLAKFLLQVNSWRIFDSLLMRTILVLWEEPLTYFILC